MSTEEDGPQVVRRGLTAEIVYGAPARKRLTDEQVDHIVRAVVAGVVCEKPIADYYDDIVAALASSEDLRIPGFHQEDVHVRNMLQRVLAGLEKNRPWPERPYESLPPADWPHLNLQREPDGVIRKAKRNLNGQIHRRWHVNGTQKDEVLVLRLRTGHIIALVAPASIRGSAVVVYALDDPLNTVAAFTELTGIDVEM